MCIHIYEGAPMFEVIYQRPPTAIREMGAKGAQASGTAVKRRQKLLQQVPK